MKLHRQLEAYLDSMHLATFNRVLGVILKDIQDLGAAPALVEVIPMAKACPNANDRIKWILAASDYKDTEEIMRVETNYQHCPVQICIPVDSSGNKLPFFMHITLPVSIYGSAEYRPGQEGGFWKVIPENHIRREHLEETIPPVNFGQKGKSELPESIRFGHALDITDDQRTEWTIHCAYGEGIVQEMDKSCFRKFMDVIPRVVSMLELWKQTKLDIHMPEPV